MTIRQHTRHTAYISIGSNIADGQREIQLARDSLAESLETVEMSDVYTTPAISGDGSIYFNAVACVVTDLDADELNVRLKHWELCRGRDDAARIARRVPIDLDIVIFDGVVLRQRDFSQTYFQIGYQSLQSK